MLEHPCVTLFMGTSRLLSTKTVEPRTTALLLLPLAGVTTEVMLSCRDAPLSSSCPVWPGWFPLEDAAAVSKVTIAIGPFTL